MTVFGINLHSILRGACKYITQLSILDLTVVMNMCHILTQDPPKRHDVFLIYAKEDEEIANEMRNFLTAAKRRFMKYLGAANIITASDVATKQSSWQHDIITAMLSSSRYGLSIFNVKVVAL